MNHHPQYPVITISREFGSGGHSIAQQLAQLLEIPFYDENIITQVAKASGYTKEFIAETGESMSKAKRLVNDFLLSNAPGFDNPQDVIFAAQKKVILAAAQSPCVIVGRCGDYILKQAGIAACHVLIYADDQQRAAYIEKKYGQTDVPIEKRLRDKDKQRKTYYQHYTGQAWGNYRNYHLCLDSGYLGAQRAAQLLFAFIKTLANA